jgi:hypothetical protein
MIPIVLSHTQPSTKDVQRFPHGGSSGTSEPLGGRREPLEPL